MKPVKYGHSQLGGAFPFVPKKSKLSKKSFIRFGGFSRPTGLGESMRSSRAVSSPFRASYCAALYAHIPPAD